MPDQQIECRDCGAAFAFTEAEQEYFRAQGFQHPPKRCKACRARQRQRNARNDVRQSRGRGGHPSAQHHGPRAAAASSAAAPAPPLEPHAGPISSTMTAPAAHPSQPPRRPIVAPTGPSPRPARPRGPMHTATCSLCGVATEVPFVPDGVRPVFCLPCLKKQTR